MNLLRKGTFARKVFIQRKIFINIAQTHHNYIQSIICPHNKREAHKRPKILQHRKVSVCGLRAAGSWRPSV